MKVALFAACVSVAGCGRVDNLTPLNEVTRIAAFDLTGSKHVTMQVGDTVMLRAYGYLISGDSLVLPISHSWTARKPSVAGMVDDGTGRIVGFTVGSTQVILASVQLAPDSVLVTVK